MTDSLLLERLSSAAELGRLGIVCATLKLPEGRIRNACDTGNLWVLTATEVEKLRAHFSGN